MNFIHCLLMSLLVMPTIHAMHIENGSTIISFNGKKKSIRDWIRDDSNGPFGETAIISTTTNQPPFFTTNFIKTLTPAEFNSIAKGFSFYCKNIKKKKNITYGAIVINPQQYHFDSVIACAISENIRNSYLEKQLEKRSITALDPN